MIDTILSYGLSTFDAMQQIGTWAASHPAAASALGGLLSEVVVKYSPWHGADGLVEIFGKAIWRAAKK